MDISEEPLELITAFAKTISAQNRCNTKIESTTNRRAALEGADYVVTTIKVGDWQPIMSKSQTEYYEVELGRSDTMGAGGVFYGARHVPVILDICRDMEELCPHAWLLNYTNPMAIITWAVNDYTHIKAVGLCHSVQSTSATIAKYIGVPIEEISYWVAGINHMAWFLELKWRGEDAYPLLTERFKNPVIYSSPDSNYNGADIVRAEIFKAFGYFVTESSRHMSEYVPYFQKTPELIETFKIMSHKSRGKTRVEEDEELREQIKNGKKFPIIHSGEYGSKIINAIETGNHLRINANVKNKGLITNLPEGCCVEVPCLVDMEGIHPCFVGDLPPQLAALNRININVQELAVRGIVEKDKNKILQSILLDPLTSSILTIDETRQLVDTMFRSEKQYMKGYI
jgi:alpha-galactosidase